MTRHRAVTTALPPSPSNFLRLAESGRPARRVPGVDRLTAAHGQRVDETYDEEGKLWQSPLLSQCSWRVLRLGRWSLACKVALRDFEAKVSVPMPRQWQWRRSQPAAGRGVGRLLQHLKLRQNPQQHCRCKSRQKNPGMAFRLDVARCFLRRQTSFLWPACEARVGVLCVVAAWEDSTRCRCPGSSSACAGLCRRLRVSNVVGIDVSVVCRLCLGVASAPAGTLWGRAAPWEGLVSEELAESSEGRLS